MTPTLASLLFWSASLAVVAGQVMILRSTRRALAAAPPKGLAREWGFALVPAFALVVVLVLSWRAT